MLCLWQNVLDSVAIIQFVLGNPISIPFDECFFAAGDGNGDGSLNVLDGRISYHLAVNTESVRFDILILSDHGSCWLYPNYSGNGLPVWICERPMCMWEHGSEL